MTSVMKSPNMMSTTGRMPVIAAPRPRPVIPASEIGESMMRSAPNSSTSPESTLNGVPASATSSPITKTAGSRRSSSASASFTACESVSSRMGRSVSVALGVDVVVHLARVRIRRRQRELDAFVDLALGFRAYALERLLGDALLGQPRRMQRQRVALRLPFRLLVPRAVVRAVDVADVVSVEAVGVEDEERRSAAGARSLDRAGGRIEDGAHVLAVDFLRLDAERLCPQAKVACRRLCVMRVLVVEVVLARVDNGQPPQRGHVHHLVEDALAERAFAEEADGDLIGATHLRGHGCAGCDTGRAGDDRVRAEVPVLVGGDVHRAALAAAVAGFLAE